VSGNNGTNGKVGKNRHFQYKSLRWHWGGGAWNGEFKFGDEGLSLGLWENLTSVCHFTYFFIYAIITCVIFTCVIFT